MKAFCLLGILGVFLLSLGSHFGKAHPFLEMLANFQLQFCVALVISCALLLLMRSRWLLRLSMTLLAAHMVNVLPWYLRLMPQAQAAPQHQIKVLLANVLFSNQQTAPLQQLIASEAPDLVVLQEASQEQLEMMKGFKPLLPYHVRARNLPYGLALWSRLPIGRPEFSLLGGGDLPSLSAEVLLSGRKMQLFTTHLTSPVREPMAERNRQLQAVSDYLRRHRETDLVLGDFNVSMWSPYYRQFEAASGFRNCRRGFGTLPSWPAQLPAWARIPIDQCLAASRVQVQNIRLGPPIGSDHLPLIIQVAL